MMLMKAASLTLQAPVAQGFGINVQQPVRVIQGVVTGLNGSVPPGMKRTTR
jgi:type VI secretion system secreted protein VgrG